MEKRPGSRIEELDVLRGIAACMVMTSHYLLNYRFYHHMPALPEAPNGAFGVYLFFVISGFVIIMTLHRCRTLMDFGVSRFSRIFPAYWSAILITSGVLFLLHSPDVPHFVQVIVGFTMLERFFGLGHVDNVYWTLNMELSFYVWMSVVFVAGGLDRIQRIIPFVLAFQALMGAYAHHVNHPFAQGVNVVLLVEYAHLFCAGVLFYEAREKGWSPWSLFLLLWCCLNQFTILFRVLPMEHRGVGDGIAILVIFLVMALVIRGSMRWIVNPVLVYLGTISYTLYLLHSEIGMAIIWRLQLRGVSYALAVGVAVLTTLLMATLLSFLVERPAMRLIRRLYKKDHPKAGIKVEPSLAAGESVR